MSERYWKQHDSILIERMVEKEKGLITESLKINTEMMTGADKNIILQAISLLENVDEEDHASTLEALIHEYDVPDTHYELLNSIECDEFKKEL